MKRIIFAFVVFAGCFFGVRSSAFATTCSTPNTFSNGTIASAPQVNANFAALVSCGNTIDNTNIGSLGIYATQIKPTTLAQAVFGGAFGYTFDPNDPGQVPLTIIGATSQTADLFDVFSVGSTTKYVWVDSSGVLHTNQAIANVAYLNVAQIFSAAQSFSNGTTNLTATGANTITSNTTGSAAAFVLNNNNGTPTTGDLLDLQKASTNAFQITNGGAVIAKSSVTAGIDGNDISYKTSAADGFLSLQDGSASGGVRVINAADTLDNLIAPDGGGLETRSGGQNTDTFVPPVYTSSGGAVSSTLHGVIASCTLSSNACTITLSGAAAFSSASSYACGGSQSFAYQGSIGIDQTSGTSITINSGFASGAVYVICFGT